MAAEPIQATGRFWHRPRCLSYQIEEKYTKEQTTNAKVIELAKEFSEGTKTTGAVCQEILDNEGRHLYPKFYQVTQFWNFYHIPWRRNTGRPKKPIKPEIEITILELSHEPLQRGIKKMHATLLLPRYDYLGPVSRHDVEKVYEKYNLYTGKTGPKKTKHVRCRYEADYANMVWHVDLHFFQRDHKVIAWIDDRSRFCVGFKFIDDKRSETIAQALLEVLERNIQPYAIWSDNGTEFRGVFDHLLQERGIIHVRTEPYNPEQNGKIERFWRTLEMAKDMSHVGQLIEEYNNTPHFGLPQIQRSRGWAPLTPQEAWDDQNRQFGPEHTPTWTINGVPGIPFPDGLRTG
jgi:transposase InsO family protein